MHESFSRDRVNPGVAAGVNKNDQIILSTIHQAKGLEWKAVFILSLTDGRFPHVKASQNQEGLEEERRLCYVGITRARDRLFMLLARQRTIYGSVSMATPSRFIAELGNEHVAFFEDSAG